MPVSERVKHTLLLNSRKLVRVSNSRNAERFLQKFCDTKRARGYRLRFIPDGELLELQDDKSLNVQMAVRTLRDAGFRPREVPWKDRPILKQIYVGR